MLACPQPIQALHLYIGLTLLLADLAWHFGVAPSALCVIGKRLAAHLIMSLETRHPVPAGMRPIHRVARRFFTYNYLNAWLPKYEDDLPRRLLRSAVIGFAASFVSDTR